MERARKENYRRARGLQAARSLYLVCYFILSGANERFNSVNHLRAVPHHRRVVNTWTVWHRFSEIYQYSYLANYVAISFEVY